MCRWVNLCVILSFSTEWIILYHEKMMHWYFLMVWEFKFALSFCWYEPCELLKNVNVRCATFHLEELLLPLCSSLTQSTVMWAHRAFWLISCSFMTKTLHLPRRLERACIRRNTFSAWSVTFLSFYLWEVHNIVSDLWWREPRLKTSSQNLRMIFV